MSVRKFFKGFRKGTEGFGNNISAIVNLVLLSITYLIGVGFTSLFAKLLRRHFLEMKISRKSRTYWSNLNLKKKSIEKYYRQF